MKTKISILIAILTALFLVIPFAVFCDEVVPAENEDLQQFDSLVKDKAKEAKEQHVRTGEETVNKKQDSTAPDNFGSFVSGEAKKKKESGVPAGYKNFGQYISEQAKKKNEARKTDDNPDLKDKKNKKDKKDNLGAVISEEAKKLKDKSNADRPFGETVRERVRKNDEKNPMAGDNPEEAGKNKSAIGDLTPEGAGSAGHQPSSAGQTDNPEKSHDKNKPETGPKH